MGRLFVVDVSMSMNWPRNRNWQTKVFDSWKVTQLNLLHQERVSISRSKETVVCLAVIHGETFNIGNYMQII